MMMFLVLAFYEGWVKNYLGITNKKPVSCSWCQLWKCQNFQCQWHPGGNRSIRLQTLKGTRWISSGQWFLSFLDCFQPTPLPRRLKNVIWPRNWSVLASRRTSWTTVRICPSNPGYAMIDSLPLSHLQGLCLTYHESLYNSSAIGSLNWDGSLDHGLFQISELWWCDGKSPKPLGCNVRCEDLLDDDIQDDVKCAMRIYDDHKRMSGSGFEAW